MSVNIVINVVGFVIQAALLAFGLYAVYRYGQSKERARWWGDAEEVTRRLRIAGSLKVAISNALGEGGNASISVNVDEFAAAITAAYNVGREEVRRDAR